MKCVEVFLVRALNKSISARTFVSKPVLINGDRCGEIVIWTILERV